MSKYMHEESYIDWGKALADVDEENIKYFIEEFGNGYATDNISMEYLGDHCWSFLNDEITDLIFTHFSNDNPEELRPFMESENVSDSKILEYYNVSELPEYHVYNDRPDMVDDEFVENNIQYFEEEFSNVDIDMLADEMKSCYPNITDESVLLVSYAISQIL